MMCKCGDKAVTPDGLCKTCMFIRDEMRRELEVKRRYDRRFKPEKFSTGCATSPS
jgi:hypothetical protein